MRFSAPEPDAVLISLVMGARRAHAGTDAG